ncbi:MAG: SDR family NAD(P)-dependent oxidoreductase [Myxococcales bacterium]|nr:SDR family NAD(P)-dependent oxidoreductase [Myxococcales bacterium]
MASRTDDFGGAFRGKVAIITGGASGIGRAVGERLARAGAKVVLADLQHELAADVARGIREQGGDAEGAPLDVTDAPAVVKLFELVLERRGALDLVFNNAGICIVGDAIALTHDDYDRLIDVNIRGVAHGTHAAYKLMAARGGGHIVNTASIAGLVPAPLFSAYAMTKHAVVGLSTSLRIEAEKHGVRVTAVCPGVIATPMVEGSELRGDIVRDEMLKKISIYPVERCAEEILRGVATNRAVVVITPIAKAGFALHRLAPFLLPGAIVKRVALARK